MRSVRDGGLFPMLQRIKSSGFAHGAQKNRRKMAKRKNRGILRVKVI